MLLEGKKLLVTGVLMDSSIAFHVARLAQEQGAEVVLTSFGRTMKITSTIAKRLPQTPPVVELDVSNSEDLDALAERVREHVPAILLRLRIAFAPGFSVLSIERLGFCVDRGGGFCCEHHTSIQSPSWRSKHAGSPASVPVAATACGDSYSAVSAHSSADSRLDGCFIGKKRCVRPSEKVTRMVFTSASRC